ncbi:aminotransferase class I/II-fold pyridoxal phosphate-dependent enzyme [Auritidibacter sp. NML100628]|uniref:aminotransferase class I/II-fold pyridoxal phosphate-dependent enzyme n=1 Tax=Auritidibacter sp. NML100628 TaxID=2170742 RepID=UPI000D7254B1|nr:aminotransferase class I/II-fold pyridoxal phosphate-dependent enzyme [Auritidibacter sp. NML100628]PXA75227.1 hypothetical protein DCC24_11770 [Auritidibacter sp. NML100628]
MPSPTVILLSGATEDELRLRAAELSSHVKNLPEAITRDPKAAREWLNDVAARLALRDVQPYRAAIVPDDIRDFDLCLQQIVTGEIVSQPSDPQQHVAVSYVPKSTSVLYLYPGQGSQRVGEHSSLAAIDDEFRHRVIELEEHFQEPRLAPHLSQAWARAQQSPEPACVDVSHTAVAQPLLAVTAIAATEALARIGVSPATVLGHSVGEFGALCGSGLLEPSSALTLIRERARCMSRVGEGTGMLAIRDSAETLQPMVNDFPGTYIACDNAPTQVVIGGDNGSLSALEDELAVRDIAYSRLRTAAAFHTPYFAEADDEFANIVHSYNWSTSETQHRAMCVSSVSAQPVLRQQDAADLISQQLARTVRFREAAHTAQQHSPHVVVQISGGDSLIHMYRQSNPDFAGMGIALGGRYDTPSGIADAIARLFLSVADFKPHRIISNGGTASMSWTQSWTSQNSVVNGATRTAPKGDDKAAAEQPHETEANRSQTAMASSPARSTLSDDSMSPPAGAESSLSTQILALFHEQVTVLSSLVGGGRVGTGQPQNYELAVNVTAPSAAGVTPDPAALDRDSLAWEVKAVVAEVGGYRVEEVSDDATIGSDLGFDSLMLTNIITRINNRLPSWVPDEERIGAADSIGDLIDVIAGQMGVSTSRPADGGVLSSSTGVDKATSDVEPETLRVYEIPDVLETTQRLHTTAEPDGSIPYYIEHESVAGSTTTVAGRELISYSSYNYLGLAGHPRVVEAVHDAVNQYGTSASAARILSGNRPLHTDLENSIASLVGAEDAVVLIGGHSTNASIIPHLYGPQDLILHDSLVHDSIHQGMKASGAKRHSFAHNDAGNLAKALEARRYRFRRALIVTEGIFSMDGDVADLPRLLEVARKYDAHIMVDEAHSIGVLGACGGGICEELGVDPAEVDILMGTLSKSLASCGGYIAGSKALVQHLRYTLSSLVFSAGLTPANTAASASAIEVMRDEPERLRRLRENSRYFLTGAQARGLNTGDASGVPVVPVILGDSATAIHVAQELNDDGISVNPIIYPAVANSMARLRFFITSEHTTQQLDKTLDRTAHAVNVAGVRQVR